MSPSAVTVLDALHSSYADQVSELCNPATTLSFLRSAGSVEVDAAMADIFDAESLKASAALSLGWKNAGIPLAQCSTCSRPVLLTRMLPHLHACEGARKSKFTSSQKEARVENDIAPDKEMNIICAPYDTNVCEDDTKSSGRTPFSSDFIAKQQPRSKDEDGPVSKSHVKMCPPKEEDNWESTLAPLGPRYVPRWSSSRRRRISLPAPVETPSQRKRSIATEKKALHAAGTAGLHPRVSQTPQAANSSMNHDPLREMAQKWGNTAQWSKLMQIAMPLALPRNPKKKQMPLKDSFGAVTGPSPLHSQGSTPGANIASRSTKPVDSTERSGASGHGSPPSLVGSLLWLRGQGIKELSQTSLHAMDVPQAPIARNGAIFHGQTYVAPVGTFETDPRAHTSIKMPVPTAPQTAGQAQNTIPGQSGRGGTSGENRSKKNSSGQSTPTGADTGSSQQPASKRQRISKQKAQAAPANMQGSIAMAHAKASAPPIRKSNLPRGTAGLNAIPNKLENVHDQQQRALAHRTGVPAGTNRNMQAVPANAAAVAAAMYGSSHAGQNKPFTSSGSSANPVMASRGTKSQLPQIASVMATGIPTVAKGTNPRAKGRSHPNGLVSNPSPNPRAAGLVGMKNQSPRQTSSRSVDRNALHRAPSVSNQFDPVLLATANSGATIGNSRVNALRGAPKHQLDFQQVMAQVSSQGAAQLQDGGAGSGSLSIPDVSAGIPLGNDKAAMHLGRQTMRSPHSRIKHSASLQAAQLRGIAMHKGNGLQAPRVIPRKDEHNHKRKSQNLEQQLRKAETVQMDMAGAELDPVTNAAAYGKRDHGMVVNNGTQGFYSASLAAAGGQGQVGGNVSKNQANLALLGMGHGPNPVVAAARGGAGGPNMLQNMHDMRQIQGVPVVPGMQNAAHPNNVLSFLQAAYNPGTPNVGMSTGMGSTMGGNMISPAQNQPVSTLAGDAILQQLLASRGAGMTPNNPLHAQQLVQPGTQLNHPHHIARTVGIPPSHPVVQPTPNALDEIDRALGINFEEKDLLD